MPTAPTIKEYTRRNEIKLIRGGTSYFDLMLELINSSVYTVHLQAYIFNSDYTGEMVAEALINAAQRQVQVYVIADGYASSGMDDGLVKRLRDSGVKFKFFEPLLRNRYFYFGRRMHHKVFVTDGLYAMVGGINVADRYNDLEDKQAWLDFALYVHGEASGMLAEFCERFWRPADLARTVPAAYIERSISSIPQEMLSSVRIRQNDWIKNQHEIFHSYLNIFNNAHDSIFIMCSYFFPGWEMLRRIKKAADRKVQIKIVLASVSDVRMAKYAERYLYHWLLKNKIRLFEYQPAVLHAKLAIADGHRMTIGSYNLNNISARASMELNIDVRNRKFVRKTAQELQQIVELDCKEITLDEYISTNGFISRTMQKVAFWCVKVLLAIFTFYFKRDKSSILQS